jgi:fumarate reductase subunit D
MRYWHRLSGLALAVFLPMHFLTLGMALEGADALDQMLQFADMRFVRWAEALLVGLLLVHFAFGTRILLVEWEARSDSGRAANIRTGWFWPALVIAGAMVLLLLLLGAGPLEH